MYFSSLCWPYWPLKISFLLHISDLWHSRECAGVCHSQTLLPQTFSCFPSPTPAQGWNSFSPVPILTFFFPPTWGMVSRNFSLVRSWAVFSWPPPLPTSPCIRCIRKNQALPCLSLPSSKMGLPKVGVSWCSSCHVTAGHCLVAPPTAVRPSRGGLCTPAFAQYLAEPLWNKGQGSTT